jgi:hypothetical protein
MRSFILIISLISKISSLQSQANEAKKPLLSSISIGVVTESNVLTGVGFENLNAIFLQNNIYTLKSALSGRGIELRFMNRKNTDGLSLTSSIYGAAGIDSSKVKNSRLAPFFNGSIIRVAYLRKIFESKRWYSTASVAASAISMNLKLVDLKKQVFELDTLLKNPSLSPQLDYKRLGVGLHFDLSTDIYYKTKWLKAIFNDFDIGAKFGYSQSLTGSFEQWLVNGTVNNLYPAQFPKVSLNNFYFQFKFLFKYNFID